MQGWGYAVFGRVVEGEDVLDKIRVVPTGSQAGHQTSLMTLSLLNLSRCSPTNHGSIPVHQRPSFKRRYAAYRTGTDNVPEARRRYRSPFYWATSSKRGLGMMMTARWRSGLPTP